LATINKFGRNTAVGTTYAPLAAGGIYRTPQVAGATRLRVKAGGNAADTAGGTGARSILLQGLNAAGEYVSEVVATNGAAASASTDTYFLRLFRFRVYESGTYATATAGSYAGVITIEGVDTVADWASLPSPAVVGFPLSQSLIGVYAVPKGWHAYVTAASYSIESAKLVDLALFIREDILDTSPPYKPMRAQKVFGGAESSGDIFLSAPLGPYRELTDIGFMGKVSQSTADVSIEFDLLLVEGPAPTNDYQLQPVGGTING